MHSLTQNWRTLTWLWVFLGLIIFTAAHTADGRAREDETEDSDTVCAYVPHRQLQRRATDDSGNGSDVGVGVDVSLARSFGSMAFTNMECVHGL